jgi:hypothetical protein
MPPTILTPTLFSLFLAQRHGASVTFLGRLRFIAGLFPLALENSAAFRLLARWASSDSQSLILATCSLTLAVPGNRSCVSVPRLRQIGFSDFIHVIVHARNST